MLTDRPIRAVAGEHSQKRLSDEELELIIWYAETGSIHGFQLCYDLADAPKAFTWTEDAGSSHRVIDPGDQDPAVNLIPILVDHIKGSAEGAAALFKARSKDLPEAIRRLVLEKIGAFR